MFKRLSAVLITFLLLCIIPVVLAYPSIIIHSPSPDGQYPTHIINFTVTINDTGACNYSLDSGLTNVVMDTADNFNFNYTNTSMSDGNYNVTFFCSDSLGENNSTNILFTVDTIAPSIEIISPQNNITYTNATVLINITSYGNYTWFFNGTNNQTYNGSIYITFSEGMHTFTAWTNDTAGNINTTSKTFTIDTMPPAIIENSNLMSGYYYNTTQTINITITDVSNFNASLYVDGFIVNNSTGTTTSNLIYALTEGNHTYYATATDVFNHTNTTINKTGIIIDTISPNLTISSHAYYTNGTTINISGTYIETNLENITINGVLATIMGGNYSVAINLTPNKNNTINASIIDKAGHANTTSDWIITDSINPTIVFNPNTDNLTSVNRGYIILNVTANDTNLNNITINIYNSNGTIINTTRNITASIYLNYTTSVDGTYYYNATAYDKAGHIGTTETRNITIDTTPPSIIINSPASTTYTVATILVNITANDTNPDKTWYNYNGTNTTYNGTINIIFSEGTNTIYVWTNDTAGNINSTNTTFIINTATPPSSSGGTTSTTKSSSSSNDYYYSAPTASTTNITTFNYYLSNINSGNNSIIIDTAGMPIIYLSMDINTNISTANTLKIISQPDNPSNISINASIYRYIIINTSIKQYINDSGFKFKISKEWIRQNNLTKDNITLYSFDKNWSKIELTQYTEDTGNIYYSSASTGLKNLAIGGPIIMPSIVAPIKEAIVEPIKENIPAETTNTTSTDVAAVEEGFFKRLSNFMLNAKNNMYTTIINLDKDTQKLLVLTISSILILIIGVVSGVILYRNTIKPKRIRREYHKQIISVSAMQYKEEPPINQTVVEPPKIIVKAAEMPSQTKIISDPEYNIKKINELLLQCEYALDNGKIEEAKTYYTEARLMYFNSGLDYERKAKVYDKIITLHNKLK